MDWTAQVMQAFGYPGLILIVLLENLFPPIPSEIVLPFAGFMAAQGTLTIPGAVLAATTGSVIGAVALYWIGLWFGRDRIYALVRRYGRILTISTADVQRTEEWFEKYGPFTVFFCRMVPVMRSLISIPAGLVNMKMPMFIFYTTVGSLIWNLVLIALGAFLGNAWGQVSQWVNYYQDVVVVVIAVLLLAAAYQLVRRKRRA